MASKQKVTKVGKIKEMIESLKSDFEGKFDEASESWQNGEKGEQCMENISACQDAIDAIEGIE